MKTEKNEQKTMLHLKVGTRKHLFYFVFAILIFVTVFLISIHSE